MRGLSSAICRFCWSGAPIPYNTPDHTDMYDGRATLLVYTSLEPRKRSSTEILRMAGRTRSWLQWTCLCSGQLSRSFPEPALPGKLLLSQRSCPQRQSSRDYLDACGSGETDPQGGVCLFGYRCEACGRRCPDEGS